MGGQGTLLGVFSESGGAPPPTPPVITLDKSSASFANTTVGLYSAAQSFTVSGSDLVDDVTITAPTGFIINQDGSLNINSSPIVLSPTSGTLAPTTIYMKFHPGAVQSYSSNLLASSSGAVTRNILMSGVAPAPSIVLSNNSFSFSSVISRSYSDAQSFTISGSFLQGDVVLTAPAGFLINLDGSTTNSSPITLAQSGGNLGSTIVYIRFHPSAVQSYSDNIAITSTAATTANVSVSGVGTTPTLNGSISSVTGLTYDEGYGPSQDSSLFNIVGVDIVPVSGNITVTPSTNVEVWDGSAWQGSFFTIPYTGGFLNTATIYKIRLKAGLSVASFSETVTLSGGNATNYVITVSGNVTVAAVITISKSTISFGNANIDNYSAADTYDVSGSDLNSDIVITAPSGFIINLDGSNTDAGPITLPSVGGTVSPTTIYVKVHPTAEQSYSGNISHVSTQATTKNVAVSAQGVYFYMVATGGTITTDGDYKVHTFTGSSNLVVSRAGTSPYNVLDYLIVAGGGGGGGSNGGGGGGAGGLKTGTLTGVTTTSYGVTIGAGGPGASSGGGSAGTVGNNSVFNGVTSSGGGYGSQQQTTGGNGGSGGGAGSGRSGVNTTGGTATAGQGNNGGGGAGSTGFGTGGGGGAGAVGQTGTTLINGSGGDGLSESITGSVVFYAGGGGGGRTSDTLLNATSGGNGGGGAGSTNGVNGVAGTANTGGGGGGGGSVLTAAGAGGSGVVVIRYKYM